MNFDVTALRKDTDERNFPYADRAVTFIHVDSSGKVWADHTKTGKVTILYDWRPGELLIAVWTGARRSDAFSVDAQAARRALVGVETARAEASRRGLGPRQNQIVKELHDEVDANGKRRYTTQQLADEFGTTPRTIREAINAATAA